MLKCTQCLQLRDESDLPCPHCGEVPYGVRNKPSQRIADPAAEKPREEPRRLGFGGAEIDFGDAPVGGLDLADDDGAPTAAVARADGPALPPLQLGPALELEPLPDAPLPPSRPLRAPELPASAFQPSPEEAEARRIADYGDPKPGPLGAVAYWWRVSTRHSDLARRRAEAKETHDGLRTSMIALLAELGRKAEEAAPATGEPRAGLVRAAREAEGRLDDEAHVSAIVESEHQTRIAKLRAHLDDLSAELAPLAEAASKARRRLDDLKAEARRAEAAMKRAEIERRNVADLIATRQEAFSDLSRPAEERDRLLAEIAELDRHGPELNERADAARAKLEELAPPLAEAQTEHDVAARVVGDKRRLADEAKERLEEAELALEADRARAGKKKEAAGKAVDETWAAVGENVLPTVERTAALTALVQLSRDAAAAAQSVEEAATRLSRLERALTCYDHDAFAQGKTYAIVGGAVLLVILTALIVLVIS